MHKLIICKLPFIFAACAFFLPAQAQVPGFASPVGEKIDASAAIDRALRASSLTSAGKPFHAVMDIGAVGDPYSGRVEIWWISSTKYREAISSPAFTQIKVVNGDQTEEKNTGGYYPRWLENFALALIDPIPVAANFRSQGAVMVSAQIKRSCLRRDDRPNGITDQITWGQVCFSGSEPKIASVLTFNDAMEFKDWKGFAKKQIASTYETSVLDYKPVIGHLNTLEELKHPDEGMFTVKTVTPIDQRIATAFVSTLKEESLIEKAPEITWPSVREGKTEGYMIVYARTDRTGQVRETSKHNSDQAGLESFGMEQALHYKFKPLLVNGAAVQMEMPLVLHFTSHLEDPLPILSVADMKKQILSCDAAAAPSPPAGYLVTIRVSVDEAGKTSGMASAGGIRNGNDFIRATQSLRSCRFAPYVVNGKPTYYKGDVAVLVP